jgi:hypothetical protein
MNIRDSSPETKQTASFALLKPQQEVVKLALQLFFRFSSFTLRRTEVIPPQNRYRPSYTISLDRTRVVMTDERRLPERDE